MIESTHQFSICFHSIGNGLHAPYTQVIQSNMLVMFAIFICQSVNTILQVNGEIIKISTSGWTKALYSIEYSICNCFFSLFDGRKMCCTIKCFHYPIESLTLISF